MKTLITPRSIFMVCCILSFTWAPIQAIAAEKVLGVPWDFQHKDTRMLCLEGDPETGASAWDAPHLNHDIHGWTYCARAATAMIAKYFLIQNGRGSEHLSQDRISYDITSGWRSSGYPPDYGFKHGFSGHHLGWALNAAIEDHTGPSFESIKTWIEAGRPMAVAWGGHYRVIDGYRDDSSGQFVHLLDPWPLSEPSENDKWVPYSNLGAGFYCGVAPASAPDVRSDEPEIWLDSDNDGIVDFDETERFDTDPTLADSDNDGVPDKQDMREYLFDRNGDYGPPDFLQNMEDELINDYPLQIDGQYVILTYLGPDYPICPYTNLDLTTGAEIDWYDNRPVIEQVRSRADFDWDGLRKELDPDNDADGLLDGEEDRNYNGIFEIEQDETSNFNPDRDVPETDKTVGDPSYSDSTGVVVVTSSTRHTLSADDPGPDQYTGIYQTYYRYYPTGSSPGAYAVYTGAFMLAGTDGYYMVEHYSKDLAGNKETALQQEECLDNLPPDMTCPADLEIECTDSNDVGDTGNATVEDACDAEPDIIHSDSISPGACPQASVIARTWTATDAFGHSSSCLQTISKVDTTAPSIASNVPASITPPDAPISFSATATDNCDNDPSVNVIQSDCFKYTKKNKRIDKTESCRVRIWGDTVTILDSGGVGTHITWTVRAVDGCGNISEQDYEVTVVNPGKNKP